MTRGLPPGGGTGACAVLTKAGVSAVAATVIPSAPTATTASDTAQRPSLNTHIHFTHPSTLSNPAHDVQTLLLFSQRSEFCC